MLIVLSNLIFPGDRMDIHKNARLTVRGRGALVKTVLLYRRTLNSAAAEFKVRGRTAGQGVGLSHGVGHTGLRAPSSAPHPFYRPVPLVLAQRVERLRGQRWTGCRIA